MASEWLKVQTFELGQEGEGPTKPLLVKSESVVSVEKLQGFGSPRATLWRFLNLVDGSCVAVFWTVELARALGLEGEVEKRYDETASRVLTAEEEEQGRMQRLQRKLDMQRLQRKLDKIDKAYNEQKQSALETTRRPFQPPNDDMEGEDPDPWSQPLRRDYGDETFPSQPFREYVAAVNRQLALAGREPFDLTAAGMAAAPQDYHDTFHRDPPPCPPAASPPSAEPAEETSSGGEESGRGTAGGAEWCSQARTLLKQLVRIDDALEGGQPLVSNQGQAMDGFTALAEFQSVARKAREQLGGEG